MPDIYLDLLLTYAGEHILVAGSLHSVGNRKLMPSALQQVLEKGPSERIGKECAPAWGPMQAGAVTCSVTCSVTCFQEHVTAVTWSPILNSNLSLSESGWLRWYSIFARTTYPEF